MRVLCFAIISSLIAFLAASAQEQQPQPAPLRERPRPYKTVELPAAAVEAPMLDGLLAVVEARVNGQGPFRFGIDTGAGGGGRVSQSLVDKLALPVVGEAMSGDPSGKSRRAVKIVEIEKLTVGEATFGGVSVSAGEFGPLEVDGIVGIGLFSEHLLTLDYPRRRIRIERGELPPADGKKVLEYVPTGGGIPTLRLRIGDIEAEAHIDSGNTRSEIVVPTAIVERLKLAAEPVTIGKARTPFNEFDIRQAPLAGSLVLGAYEARNPRIDIVDLFPYVNLGHKFLQRFTVTIDAKNRRIRFEPEAT